MPATRTLFNLRIPARDGVELAADVLLPAGEGPFPTVVIRTPYIRQAKLGPPYGTLVDKGYALVSVDMRGRGDSGGEWRPFVNDADDAYDTVEWLAAQDWSTGRIGMVGGSYDGLTQWWTAKAHPPSLRCIVPMAVGARRRSEIWSRGTGVPVQYWAWWFNMVTGRTNQHPGAPSWEAGIDHLPLATLHERLGTTSSAWPQYVAGEIDYLSEDFALSAEDWENLDVPALVWVGWWDDQETMDTWQAVKQSKAGAQCRLVIGAWDHGGNIAPRPVLGGVDVSTGLIDPMAEVDRFLAYHLKDDTGALDGKARCRVVRTGPMQWEDLDDWPAPGTTPQPWYLHSEGDARTLHGNGTLSTEVPSAGDAAADTFVYDPSNPGRDLSNLDMFAWSDPPLDHSYLHRRKDTLVYTSAPLEDPLRLSGVVHAELAFSTDAEDTDVVVSLADVLPDGRAISFGIGDSALRLRHCEDRGDITVVRLPVAWLHHEFGVGHRIRLTVRSSGFVFLARNLNTGGEWGDEVEPVVATNTVHHSPEHPSRLLLPVEEAAR